MPLLFDLGVTLNRLAYTPKNPTITYIDVTQKALSSVDLKF